MSSLRHILELLELTLPFPLSPGHSLLGDLSNKAFFELEEAPGFAESMLTPIQPDEKEIGQDRQRNRALHPLLVFGHLHLAHVHPALEFFYGQFHTPTPRVHTENHPRARLGAIGHDDFDALRPIVTPFLGQDDRDIAQIMERGAAEKDPIVAAAPVRFVTGSASVTALREVVHEVTEMFAVGKFACPWHGKDIRIVSLGNQAQGRVGSKPGIGDDDNVACPRWRHKVLQHLPKENVLMPSTRRLNQRQGHGNAYMLPTGDEQDRLKTKGVRVMLAVARRAAQRMLPAPLLFHCAVPDQIQDPVRRRWERTERGHCQVTHHGLRLPLSRTEHPHSRPVFERGWQVRCEPFERPLARVTDEGNEQPTEDQKVLRLGAVKVPLERVECLVYFAWDACATPHVSRSCVFWDVGCIQNTQEH